MTAVRSLDEFQLVLDRVASTGEREEVEQEGLPDVKAWDRLDSRGCSIHVDRGHWYVVPPLRVQNA